MLFRSDSIIKYDENYPPPQSLNKRYRIVESSPWSPGDAPIAYFNGWLHDTTSDEYSFIDIFTSAYGGNGDICKFIDDSRFYRIDFPGPASIYNIIESKPQPAFTLQGEAIAITYSSSHRQYYVLELGEKAADLAIWDENGELISRHSTSIPITNHFEGIYKPDISVSGNTLHYESPDLDGWVEGTLDLTTFEFIQIAKE